MKNNFKIVLLILFLGYAGTDYAQSVNKSDSLGLPGDNLNLYAVLDLFQKCETFEEFEKKLNQEDSKINNLDLNNDKKIDYIRVIDNKNGDNHAIVLQTPINEKENQDIAVIEIEKKKDGNYTVQIIGDEELYGKDYIIEPQENDPDKKQMAANNPNVKQKSDTTVSADGKTVIVNNYYTTNNYNTTNNNSSNSNRPDVVYVSVNYWPMIHYIYAPGYTVYVSPWYWYYYPTWWHPWNPWFWHDYYWHHYHHYHHYYGWYHRAPNYRNPVTHSYYGQRKVTSATVTENRVKGNYIQTYNSPNPNKGKPATPNPGFKPDKVNENRPMQKPAQSDFAKPETKPNQSKPNPSKPDYNKPQPKPDYNKSKPSPNPPMSRPPAPKPQPHPNMSKPQQGQKKR